MPDKTNEKTKNMPPPAVPAKEVEPQVTRVGSEASKAEEKSTHKRKQENTKKHSSLSSLGGIVGPARKKARSKVPTHSERVESALKQYEEDRAEQEEEEEEGGEEEEEEEEEEEGGEEEDTQKYSDVGASIQDLPKYRDSQKGKLSHQGDSVLGDQMAVESGSQLGAKVASRRLKEAPARESEPQSSRGKVSSEGPSMGAKGPVAGNRDTSQAPVGSQVTKHLGQQF